MSRSTPVSVSLLSHVGCRGVKASRAITMETANLTTGYHPARIMGFFFHLWSQGAELDKLSLRRLTGRHRRKLGKFNSKHQTDSHRQFNKRSSETTGLVPTD